MLASLSRPRKPCSPCFRGRTQLQRGPERNRLQAYHRTFSIAGVLNSEVKVELLADHCLAGGSTPESPYLGCPLTYATPLLAYLKFLAILDSRQTRIYTQGGYLSGMSEDFNRMADVKLLVEDQSVPAHKTVLAASSDVFAELFAGLPKSDSKLPLQEESLADVHLTLTYLYSDFSFGAPSQAIRSVEDAKRLTKFAYKYAMKQMSQMCEEYLISQVSEGKYGFRKQRARDEEPLVSLTCLAEDCGLPKLLAHCEHALVEQADHGLWHSDEVISGQISRRSLLEILRSHQTYNCCCANVSEMLAWQDHDSCAKEDQK